MENQNAQLINARWQLEQTVVRAPSDGYVVNLQLRPGVRVVTMPMAAPMAFASSEFYEVVASLSQSSARRVEVGNTAEMVFASRPGEVFTGKIVGHNPGHGSGAAHSQRGPAHIHRSAHSGASSYSHRAG